MAALGRPGVYVQESLTPLPTTSTDTGNAMAAFVGTATFGPSVPTLVTSWAQYAALYNGFGTTADLLPYAVYSYFANGGTGCYVVRATASDAVAASVVLNDQQGTPATLMRITAKSVGAFGNQIYITVVANPTPGYFDLIVAVGATSNVTDRYIGVTLNPSDPRYLLSIINSPTDGSQVISIAYTSATSPWTTAQTPAAQTNTPLTGGSDGTSSNINLVTSTEQLATVQSVLNVNLPGITSAATINALTTWAANQGNVFLVIDSPQASSTESATLAAYLALAPNAQTGTPYTQSSYAAMYGPWLVTNDPSSLAAGAVRTLPPGGAVLGQYAAVDAATGPYQSPSGTGTTLVGVVGVDQTFQAANLDTLNNANVNVIRTVPRYGFCIMGGRTLAYGMPSRYVNIRRTLMFIESLCKRSVQFALFQPNNSILWNKIDSVLNQALGALMQAGYFASNVASNAYWVRCDSSNNVPSSTSTGVVHIDIGVALSAPAEYVLINIGLFDSTTAVSSTLP